MVFLQMKFVSNAPADFYNCSTPATSTASVNALCNFMDIYRISQDFHQQLRSMFNSLNRSVAKQREWIAATFSGHPQAAAVLAVVNFGNGINCKLSTSGQVTCPK